MSHQSVLATNVWHDFIGRTSKCILISIKSRPCKEGLILRKETGVTNVTRHRNINEACNWSALLRLLILLILRVLIPTSKYRIF